MRRIILQRLAVGVVVEDDVRNYMERNRISIYVQLV